MMPHKAKLEPYLCVVRWMALASFCLLGVLVAAEVKVESPCVGIDLGTTYSVVGIWQGDGVEIIPNELGNRITPSVVSFGEERLVGDAARNQMETNYRNTVYAVKRLIGRTYADATVQADKKILAYDVVGDAQGRAAVRVQDEHGNPKVYKPEEISAMVLQKMKLIAESYVNEPVRHAVVTVPAYFNEAQRQATKDAGTIAGLHVARILNEPTAAAIAYGMDQMGKELKVLVFDLGGGTFDVSLLSIDSGFFEVEATSGDTHLGGEDFDGRVVQYLLGVAQKKHHVDLSKNPQALARLRKAVESAKRRLSSQLEAMVEVDNIAPGVDLSESLTRGKFEELNMDLFRGTLEPVKAVLGDAGIEKDDVDEVVLVGGSTRIPKVRQLIKEFFNGKEPSGSINPDEAVAYGAAVHAGVLSGQSKLKGQLVLTDVISLSLGIETQGGVMLSIIPRNTNIPASKRSSVTTVDDDQTEINFKVYEGERAMVRDNRLLGQFRLTGIPKGPAGTPSVEVRMDVDENGILQVRAEEKSTGATESVEIVNEKGRLTQEEIDRMIAEAHAFEEADKKARDLAYRAEEFQRLARTYGAHKGKPEAKEALTEAEFKILEDTVSDAGAFLREGREDATLEDYERRLEEMKNRAGAIVEKIKRHKSSSSSSNGDESSQNNAAGDTTSGSTEDNLFMDEDEADEL